MNSLLILVAGIAAGALSWAICPLVSDSFEPFDSTLGLIIGQVLLVSLAGYIGYKFTLRALGIVIFGMHGGQIAYLYLFGSNEQRIWIFFGMATTLGFLVLPLLFGVLIRSFSKK